MSNTDLPPSSEYRAREGGWAHAHFDPVIEDEPGWILRATRPILPHLDARDPRYNANVSHRTVVEPLVKWVNPRAKTPTVITMPIGEATALRDALTEAIDWANEEYRLPPPTKVPREDRGGYLRG